VPAEVPAQRPVVTVAAFLQDARPEPLLVRHAAG
jgi:hypothetical protein